MSSSCTPIFVGMTSLVLEILLPFKNGQISLWGMDYSPWSSKNLIDQNRLKKFMQVGIDVNFMHTNFGERGFSGFGDTAFQNDSVNILIISFVLVLLGSYWYISGWFGAVVS